MRILAIILLTCLMGCASAQRRHPQETASPPVNHRRAHTTSSQYPLSHAKDASTLPSRIALCTEDEPGERMVISGTVYGADGVTPVKGAIVYLYQTDAHGVYSEEQENSGRPKLRGYLRTDSDGKYEIHSIKPGHYPHVDAAAHLHVHVWAPDQPEYEDLFEFYDDRLISDADRAKADSEPGDFSLIKLLPGKDGGLRGVRNIKPVTSSFPTFPAEITGPLNPPLEEELLKIMLSITADWQRGMLREFGRYGRGVARENKFTNTNAVGRVRNAPPAIPIHPLEQRSTELLDIRVREHGDTIIMSYRQLDKVELKEQKFTKSLRVTVVFMRKVDGWQIIAFHVSPVAFDRVAATVTPNVLDSYAGTYENPLWGTYDVTCEGDMLVFTSKNGYRTEYLPESETEFFEKDEEARKATLQTVSFVRNDNGQVTHCVFRQSDGQNIVVKKAR